MKNLWTIELKSSLARKPIDTVEEIVLGSLKAFYWCFWLLIWCQWILSVYLVNPQQGSPFPHNDSASIDTGTKDMMGITVVGTSSDSLGGSSILGPPLQAQCQGMQSFPHMECPGCLCHAAIISVVISYYRQAVVAIYSVTKQLVQ